MSCLKLILKKPMIGLIGISLGLLLLILASLLKLSISSWTVPLQKLWPSNGIVRSWNPLLLKEVLDKVTQCLLIFLFCVWRRSLFLYNKKVDEQLWLPVKVDRNGPSISHLFFIDDCLLFTEAKSSQVQLVKEVLDIFCKASGLKVNLQKSRFMSSNNISHVKIQKFASISLFQHTRQIGHYLGFPMLQGQTRNRDFNFILERINSRLAGWKMELLNRAAQSVLSSMPIYTMQNLWVPKGIWDKIDSTICRFIWGQNHSHWVNWETISLPKALGGLK